MTRKTRKTRQAPKIYTAAQVNEFRARLQREFALEKAEYGQRLYDMGVRAGEQAIRDTIINLLGLHDRFMGQ
jgi:guanylate kinase